MGDISKIAVDDVTYYIKDSTARLKVEELESDLPSKVSDEVKEYLDKNPPQSSGSVSEQDILNAVTQYFNDHPVKNGQNGADGVGIQSIVKTSTSGLVDTYTITLTDSSTTTFTVTNGKDGSAGSGTITDDQIKSVVEDYLSENPIQKGEDGFSPIVTVSEIAGGHSVSVQTKDTTEVFNVMNGVDGQNGQDGVNGKSAYELAVENGFEGTVEEWLESLKGNDGSNGITEDDVNNLIQSAIGDVIGGEY